MHNKARFIEEIAEGLKVARRRKGLSQRGLSERTGVAQSHISKIEKGLVDLQVSSLVEVARAVDLEVVLVRRENLTAVEGIERYGREGGRSIPAYQLRAGDEDG